MKHWSTCMCAHVDIYVCVSLAGNYECSRWFLLWFALQNVSMVDLMLKGWQAKFWQMTIVWLPTFLPTLEKLLIFFGNFWFCQMLACQILAWNLLCFVCSPSISFNQPQTSTKGNGDASLWYSCQTAKPSKIVYLPCRCQVLGPMKPRQLWH